MNSSRRYFLKVAGLSTFALAAGAAKAEAAEATYEAYPEAKKAKRWAMVIDTRRFKTPESVNAIMEACHKEHNVPSKPGPKEVKWIWDDTFEHAFADDPNPILPKDIEERRFLLLCNHCTNPSCVRVCPAGATYKVEGGIVAIDYHRCVGCRFCMAACPYGSRSFNFSDPRPYIKDLNAAYPTRMRGVVEKCTFCAERLEKGMMPACVEASNGAIMFGDLNDPNSLVRRVLGKNYCVRRKPSLGTDAGVYYII